MVEANPTSVLRTTEAVSCLRDRNVTHKILDIRPRCGRIDDLHLDAFSHISVEKPRQVKEYVAFPVIYIGNKELFRRLLERVNSSKDGGSMRRTSGIGDNGRQWSK